MKSILVAFTMLIAGLAFAHDEGHGPKLTDSPKYGGKVAAVIDKKEVKLGIKAKLLYKTEITKNNEGMIRVYFYDEKMNLLKDNTFLDGSAELQFQDGKSKKWQSQEFKLEKKDGGFEGKLPTVPKKRFNVDVTVKNGEQSLFSAFDGLR